MAPTVFRIGAYRFCFFSNEEPRMHVHVQGPDGEAKFWLEPRVAVARVARPTADHLYWPSLDIDLSVESLDRPHRYPLRSRVGLGKARPSRS
jgi:hypothetical protein